MVHDDVLATLPYAVHSVVEEHDLPGLTRAGECTAQPALVTIDRAQPHDVGRIEDDETHEREVDIVAAL